MLTILFLLLTLAMIAYISYPLINKSQTNTDVVSDSGILELSAERDRVYTALAELDFDYECGKVSDEDYQGLRQELLQDAASVLASIESDSTTPDVGTPQKPQSKDIVEDEIARYKKERKT